MLSKLVKHGQEVVKPQNVIQWSWEDKFGMLLDQFEDFHEFECAMVITVFIFLPAPGSKFGLVSPRNVMLTWCAYPHVALVGRSPTLAKNGGLGDIPIPGFVPLQEFCSPIRLQHLSVCFQMLQSDWTTLKCCNLIGLQNSCSGYKSG